MRSALQQEAEQNHKTIQSFLSDIIDETDCLSVTSSWIVATIISDVYSDVQLKLDTQEEVNSIDVVESQIKVLKDVLKELKRSKIILIESRNDQESAVESQ